MFTDIDTLGDLAERGAVGRPARLAIDCGDKEMVKRQRRFEEK